MGKVKEKTLRKIEDFFARETTVRGTQEIQVSLEDLRKETQLSLVTIYKAIDVLVAAGKLEILQQGNRRSPKLYRYLAGPSAYAVPDPLPDLIGIGKVLEELIHELAVKEQVIEALRAKLATYETPENQVLYRLQVGDGVEVIVRKKRERGGD